MDKEQLRDKLIGVIMNHSGLSLLEVGMAFQRLRSFDRLLSAITEAKGQNKALSTIIDGMEAA